MIFFGVFIKIIFLKTERSLYKKFFKGKTTLIKAHKNQVIFLFIKVITMFFVKTNIGAFLENNI